MDAPVPWGEDTLFTLEFRPATMADDDSHGGDRAKSEGGHYALHTCNNKYLARDGKLLDACTRDCLYAAEFHAGLLALRYDQNCAKGNIKPGTLTRSFDVGAPEFEGRTHYVVTILSFAINGST